MVEKSLIPHLFLTQSSAIAGNKIPNRLQQRDLNARWVKKMKSITMVIRTVFALMLSTVLSDAYWLPLKILINYKSGQILNILASASKIYLA